MTTLPIVFLGNAALRRVSKRVVDPRASTVRALVANLEAQVRKENGVGIAAPQLGVNTRVFLMLKDAPKREEDLPDEDSQLEYQECINPEILQASSTLAKDFEGCLSIPGYVGIVRRSREIQVQYNDMHGQRHKKILRDFPARIFQHELDHLNGVLYIDKIEKDTLMHNDEFNLLDQDALIKLLRK